MKRFVTYLYEYERGMKTRSAGFIRVDIRNGMVSMEICVRKFFKNVEKGMVYALVTKNGLYGEALGEMKIYGGQGDLKLLMQEGDIAKKGISVADMAGVGIWFGEQGYVASCWEDAYAQQIGEGKFSFYDGVDLKENYSERNIQEVVRAGDEFPEKEFMKERETEGRFVAAENPDSKSVEIKVQEGSLVGNESMNSEYRGVEMQESNFLENKGMDSNFTKIENTVWDFGKSEITDNVYTEQIVKGTAEWEKHLQMPAKAVFEKNTSSESQALDAYGVGTDEKIESCCMEKQYIYKKMDLTHTRELPPPDRHYGSNAFLIHGFWNYGYLIHKEEVAGDQKTVSLGVPGVYERQEAAMAMAFGFPNFETFPMEMMDEMFLKERRFSEKEINDQPPKARLFGCWFVDLHS